MLQSIDLLGTSDLHPSVNHCSQVDQRNPIAEQSE